MATSIYECVKAYNLRPYVKTYLDRLGYSLHTQRPDMTTIAENIDLCRDPGLPYFLTDNPTCLVVFHRNSTDFTTMERTMCLRSLFPEKRSTLSERISTAEKRHLHLNCPSSGQFLKITPHTSGQNPDVLDNKWFIKAREAIWNDPAIQMPIEGVPLAGPWKKEEIKYLRPHQWERWTEHGYLPLDYKIARVAVMNKEFGSYDKIAWNWESPAYLPTRELWEIPITLWVTPIGITLWRHRSLEANWRRIEEQLSRGFLTENRLRPSTDADTSTADPYEGLSYVDIISGEVVFTAQSSSAQPEHCSTSDAASTTAPSTTAQSSNTTTTTSTRVAPKSKGTPQNQILSTKKN